MYAGLHVQAMKNGSALSRLHRHAAPREMQLCDRAATAIRLLQVADFLEAPTKPAAAQFCAALRRRKRAAPPAWALLKVESAHIRDIVTGHHPALSSTPTLAKALPQLPKCMGLRALRFYMQAQQKAHASDRFCVGWQLELDLECKEVVTDVPALLPALTELTSLKH